MTDDSLPAPEAPEPLASPEAADVDGVGVEYADDPWFREETRYHVWDRETPDPPGLVDALSSDLIYAARYVLAFIISSFHGPATIALLGKIWHDRKAQLLNLLCPIEQVLRRFLLIEAFALAASQSLPRSVSRPHARAKRPRRLIELDPAHPETWPVRFRVSPPNPVRRKRGARAKLLSPDPNDIRSVPHTPPRRKLHDAWPLARRLEAVFRILDNPAPFIRRLAFRIGRGPAACPTIDLLTLYKPKSARECCQDSNAAAAARLYELIQQHWSSG